MNMQDILNLSRTLTNKTKEQVPDDVLLKYTNIIYKELVRKIINGVNEDYFYDRWKTDLISNQNEYVLEKVLSNNKWILKLLWLSIKYNDNNSYYTKAKEINLSDMIKSEDYYIKNQPASNPLYRIADNSIFIYPAPTEEVQDWLKLHWIYNAVDLNISATEEDFIIPSSYLYLITLGNMYYIYISQWLLNEASLSKQNYLLEVNKMISELEERNLSPEEIILPNLTNLK